MADESRFYWIKLRTDFFNQQTVDFLLSQKNGCEYVVLYQMLCLQTANNNGELSTRIGEMIIPYDVDKVVRDTKYFDFDTVTVALELFKQLGLIYISDESGMLRIADYSSMIGSESGSKAAVKKREYRERIKNEDKKGDKKGDKLSDRDKRLEIRDKRLDIRDIDIKKTEKTANAVVLADEIESYTTNSELSAALNDYFKMRKAMKTPNTERAIKLCFNKLDSLASTDEEKLKVVEQSIERGWKTFYPLKGENKQEVYKQPTAADYDFSDWYK